MMVLRTLSLPDACGAWESRPSSGALRARALALLARAAGIRVGNPDVRGIWRLGGHLVTSRQVRLWPTRFSVTGVAERRWETSGGFAVNASGRCAYVRSAIIHSCDLG